VCTCVKASAKKSLRGSGERGRYVCVYMYTASVTNYGISCVCVCVRRQTQKGNTASRHNIESTRRCGGVFVCGTPCRRDGSSGKRVNFGGGGQRKTEVSRHTSVCVSLSPPPPSYIPIRVHIPMHTIYGGSGAFHEFSRAFLTLDEYIYTYVGTHCRDRHFTPTIPSLYSSAKRTYTHGGSHLSASHMAKLS